MTTEATEAEVYWVECVRRWFPDLHTRTSLVPPVHLNRVPYADVTVAGQHVLVPQEPHEDPVQPAQIQGSSVRTRSSAASSHHPVIFPSDVREDRAQQRVLFCLEKLAEAQEEVMVVLSQLQFGDYLNMPCYAAAAAQLPGPKDLDKKFHRGDFDILAVHRQYGLLICEIKSVGGNTSAHGLTERELRDTVMKKTRLAVKQLDKAEMVLSHIVSDLAPGLTVRKSFVLPSVTRSQLQQALSENPDVAQELCRCLDASSPSDVVNLCLCSNQLSAPHAPWNVTSSVLRELSGWWRHRVAANKPDHRMTTSVYERLVARLCGPATSVSLPGKRASRVHVHLKSLGHGVSEIGQKMTCLTLYPPQVNLLQDALPRIMLLGPPGTGKTVVLTLMAAEWLRRDRTCIVRVLSALSRTRAVSLVIFHHLRQMVERDASGRVKLLKYNFWKLEDVHAALDVLVKRVSTEGRLYVLVDEAGPHINKHFQVFCDKLFARVPGLHLWAAAMEEAPVPQCLVSHRLTTPLRCPPVVVREVAKAQEIDVGEIQAYTDRGVPWASDGPTVIRRVHAAGEGHTGVFPQNCVQCGREVAGILRQLGVGAAAGQTPRPLSAKDDATPPPLEYRDVLVACWEAVSSDTGILRGLREAGVPVQAVTPEDDLTDMALAVSDHVTLAHHDTVRGLERKVVVVAAPYGLDHKFTRLQAASRCTAQLVVLES